MEGILAGILLLAYTASFFSLQPFDAQWNKVHTDQEMHEYLQVVGATPLSTLVLQDKRREFLGVTQRILGSGKGYSLETENLVAPSMDIAVLLAPTVQDAPVVTSAGKLASCQQSEFSCFTLTFRGTNFLVSDNTTNGQRNYNAIFHNAEGPFYVGDLVTLDNGEKWQIGKIAYAVAEPLTIDTTFFNATFVLQLKNALNPSYRFAPLSFNGRMVDERVAAYLIGDPNLGEHDVLVIPDTLLVNSTVHDILAPLVYGGVDIVALLSAQTTVTAEFNNLTNSRVVSYGTQGSPADEETIAPLSFLHPMFTSGRYMAGLGFDIDTGNAGNTGTVKLGQTTYGVAVTRSAPSDPFDRFSIDGGSPLAVSQTFVKDGNTYTVKYIQADGRFATVQMSETHTFREFSFPDSRVPANNKTGELVIIKPSAFYVAPGPEPPGMLVNQSTIDNDNTFAGQSYGVSLDPPSITYDGLQYPNDAAVQIGPDTFSFHIIDPTTVNWTLRQRWNVPQAISNQESTGTVLLLPLPDSDDEWAYMRSALLQLVKGPREMLRSTQGKKGSVSGSDTFLASGDFYDVYRVTMRAWY